MNAAERRSAIRAGERWASECDGELLPFDALAHLRLIGDTTDPDLRAEQMRVAQAAAEEKRGTR